MKKNTFKNCVGFAVFFFTFLLQAQVTLESEVKITDKAMYFNGVRIPITTTTNSTTGYDYVYGNALSPHGDCIKTYKQYVFMTWYRGGKNDRHVMLTRYNTVTGTMKTIEFPHQHTGYNGQWWIGETHNTIAVAISPLNGTIHMVYDMHAYGNGGAFVNDYFRYSYSVNNTAELPDADFTLDKFVKDPLDGDYKHCTMDGVRDPGHYSKFSYPEFFLNDQNELFLTMRNGTSHDGAQAFIKYDASAKKWGRFKYFNALKAQSKGETHDWSIYGNIKYVDGKIRIGFQRRLNDGTDKYEAQNGVYYAYSDDPTGETQWKNHKGEPITFPLVKAQEVLIYEPGDYVQATSRNSLFISSGFDWTVTDKGDVHIISRVKDKVNNITKNIHSYKPQGASDFIISTDFTGAEALYTSGDYVYIIGLNSTGRPFVERALGGTNQFTRVYDATTGRRFRKGSVYIADGKLYYYLLENNAANTTDTQTTYLQVIDLKIQEGPKTFGVNLTSPTDNQSFQEGENVQLYATATTDTGLLTKVEFFINGQVYNQDTTAPYLFDWIPSAIGNYTIKAIAYNDSGNSIASSEVSITVTAVDKSDLTTNKYRLKNVGTGTYLTSPGTNLTMSSSGVGDDKIWSFVKTTFNGVEYYNIDSEVSGRGILRATGGGYVIPYEVINTNVSAPRADSDKIWTVYHDDEDDTYRFEAASGGRFLYISEIDGKIYNMPVDASDDRSKWVLELSTTPLGLNKNKFDSSFLKVFPNPTKDKFVILFDGLNTAHVKISDMLGRILYSTFTSKGSIELTKSDVFLPGIYLIQVIGDNGEQATKKLIVN
ncbi:BNR-4 repeat-containing protein [Flavobacterium faecale]|uniref:BNR-4 repeat-containing protein n=1 Tax=Flavobacterium faecale TaxID=1355330 RepID=UPI003AAED428